MMKKAINILSAACFVLFAATGCDDDNYPDLQHPDPDQEFPQKEIEYMPGSADGLTNPPTQVFLPKENAKTYYVDGVNPGQETVASYTGGRRPENILDGDVKTNWHINTVNAIPDADYTATTVDLVITVPEGTEFDYLMFVNLDNFRGNGFPVQFEWYLSTASAPDDLIHQGTITQLSDRNTNPGITPGYDRYAHKIPIPGRYVNQVGKIKFRFSFANCQGNNYACFCELEFWKLGEVADMPDFFTDLSCTALKPGTTQEDIDEIRAPFYKNIAQALYSGYYEKERIASVPSTAKPDDVAAINHSLPYGDLHYPTGIYVQAGEDMVVLADGILDEVNLTIVGKNKPNNNTGIQDVALHNGINSFVCDMSGTVYLSGFGEAQSPATVNIASGFVTGSFNQAEYDRNTVSFLGSRLRNSDNIDIVGEHFMLTVAASDFIDYFKNPEDLISRYEELIAFQQNFAGMTVNTARLHYVESSAANPELGFAAYRGAFKPAYAPAMLDPEAFKNSIDDIAGFTAQANIPNEFTWPAVNNANQVLYAAATAKHMGLPGVFEKEPEIYADAYKHFVVNGTLHDNSASAGYKQINAVPLWQLQLYFSEVKGESGFYAGVMQALRKSGLNNRVNFAQAVCEQSGYNLTSFFNTWGYNLPVDFETANLAPAVAANVPAQAVEFISDAAVGLYRSPAAVSVAASGYTADENRFHFDFSGCKNAAAFEVLIDGKTAWVSVQDKFSFPAAAGEVTANAIAQDGTKTPVAVTLK